MCGPFIVLALGIARLGAKFKDITNVFYSILEEIRNHLYFAPTRIERRLDLHRNSIV